MVATLGLCLALAATSAAPVFVPAERFTLAWTHSIEKVRWEEDYAVTATPTPRLQALAARVRGSAAGMEPPDDARWVNGWYTYTPALRYPDVLRLTRSVFSADYDLCVNGLCQPMSDSLASDGGITLLSACSSDAAQAR